MGKWTQGKYSDKGAVEGLLGNDLKDIKQLDPKINPLLNKIDSDKYVIKDL